MKKILFVLSLFLFAQFVSLGGVIRVERDEEINLLLKKFDKNPADVVVVRNLLKTMSSAGLNTETIVNKYFATQAKGDYVKEYNWEIIRDYASNVLVGPLNYVLKNKRDFVSKFSKEEVFQKLDYSYAHFLDGFYRTDVVKFSKYLNLLKDFEYEHADVIKDYFGIRELRVLKKSDEYFYKARKLFRYFPEDRDMIREITTGALEIMNDVSRLKVIQLWAGKTVEKGQDLDSFYKYSKISFKAGFSSLGLQYAKKAFIIAEKNNNDEYVNKCRELVATIENNLKE